MSINALPPRLVVHRGDLLAAGMSSSQLRSHLRSGRWSTIRNGTYWTGPGPTPPGVVAAVVVEAAGEGAVASHHTAARARHLPWVPADRQHHVVVPPGSSARGGKGVRVHQRTLAPAASVLRVGARRWTLAGTVPVPDPLVSDVLPTVLDLAATLRRPEAAWVVATTVADGLPVVQLRERARTLRGPGCANARRAVEDAEPRCRSLLEMALLLVIRQAGLPEPLVNHLIRDRDGTPVAEADFFFQGGPLDVEADGTEVHTTAVFADRQRQNALAGLGIAVLRFTWPDVFRRPAWVAAQISASLSQRAAA